MSIAYGIRDEQLVDGMLSEAGETDSAGLRLVLLELRSLANSPVPEPSVELAAFLSRDVAAPGVAALDSRRRRKHRPVLLSLTIITAMGLGIGAAAAASPDFRNAAQHAITTAVNAIATVVHPSAAHPGTPVNPRSGLSQPLISPSPIPSANRPANRQLPILPTIPARSGHSLAARPPAAR